MLEARTLKRSWAGEPWYVDFPVRVLVAEDNPDMRKLVGTVLRNDGYEVVEAKDGAEFLERLSSSGPQVPREIRGEPPDLVIADIVMPGANGLEVLESLRQEQWAIPVILMTAYADKDTAKEAKRLGAAAFFEKPFDLFQLRRAVRDIVPP